MRYLRWGSLHPPPDLLRKAKATELSTERWMCSFGLPKLLMVCTAAWSSFTLMCNTYMSLQKSWTAVLVVVSKPAHTGSELSEWRV